MKKLLMISLFVAMLSGCKKGPNDPGFSLRSRDQRIVGDWTMESSETIYSTNGASGLVEIRHALSGSSMTNSVSSPSGGSASASFGYQSSLHIKKDGTIRFEETVIPPGGTPSTNRHTGHWAWADAGRKKSGILITDMPVSTGNYVFMEEGLYTIDELRNDKLVLKRFKGYDSPDPDVEANSTSVTMTFSK